MLDMIVRVIDDTTFLISFPTTEAEREEVNDTLRQEANDLASLFLDELEALLKPDEAVDFELRGLDPLINTLRKADTLEEATQAVSDFVTGAPVDLDEFGNIEIPLELLRIILDDIVRYMVPGTPLSQEFITSTIMLQPSIAKFLKQMIIYNTHGPVDWTRWALGELS